MKSDIKLSTGTVIKHRPLANGATEAYAEPDNGMTAAEWTEYCGIVKDGAKNAANIPIKGSFRYGVNNGVCFEVVLEGADSSGKLWRVWGGTFTYCPGGPEEAVKFAANRKPELVGETVKVYKLLPESKIGATWAELVGTFKVPPAL